MAGHPERIGVAGAGTMGAGIAQVACLGGFTTYLHDPDPAALTAGEDRLRADLLKGVDRGRWTQADAEAASARLRGARALGELETCELIIEAAPESLDLKRQLFAELESICEPSAVLATNTSSLSVSEIAAAAERPGRICGMHFFNPPALMKLVEIVAGKDTAPEVLEVASQVAERMGRTPIRAADGIGFLANRCARPFTLEALRLVGERVAPPDQVDRIVRVGGGYRMGPFELMDLVGVDVNLKVAKSFFEQSGGEPRWQPHPLQQRLVVDGRLGRNVRRALRWGWFALGLRLGATRSDRHVLGWEVRRSTPDVALLAASSRLSCRPNCSASASSTRCASPPSCNRRTRSHARCGPGVASTGRAVPPRAGRPQDS